MTSPNWRSIHFSAVSFFATGCANLSSKPSSLAHFVAFSINARRPLPSAFSSYLLSTYITGSGLLYSLTAALILVNLYFSSNDLSPLPPSFLGRYISSVDPKGCLPQLWTITFLTSLPSLYVSSVFLTYRIQLLMLQSRLTPPLLCSASTNSLFLCRLYKLMLLNCLHFNFCLFLMHLQG